MFFVYLFFGILLGLFGSFIYHTINSFLDFIENFQNKEEYDVIDLEDYEEEDNSCGKI